MLFQFSDILRNDDYINSFPEVSGKYRYAYNITVGDTHDGWFDVCFQKKKEFSKIEF